MAKSVNLGIVQSFFEALRASDLDRALAMMTDDVIYENVPLAPHRGQAQTAQALRSILRLTPEVDIRVHAIASTGPVVLTERTDVLRGPLLDLEFWVCGTFEIREGKISVWRDRFDVGQVLFQVATSPLRKLLHYARSLEAAPPVASQASTGNGAGRPLDVSAQNLK